MFKEPAPHQHLVNSSAKFLVSRSCAFMPPWIFYKFIGFHKTTSLKILQINFMKTDTVTKSNCTIQEHHDISLHLFRAFPTSFTIIIKVSSFSVKVIPVVCFLHILRL